MNRAREWRTASSFCQAAHHPACPAQCWRRRPRTPTRCPRRLFWKAARQDRAAVDETPPAGSAARLAIMQPGMFLSQPPMATRPSSCSQPITVSIESAITLARHERILHPLSAHGDGVGDGDGIERSAPCCPPSATPSEAAMRQLVDCGCCTASPGDQVDAIPIWDFWKSPCSKPNRMEHRAIRRALDRRRRPVPTSACGSDLRVGVERDAVFFIRRYFTQEFDASQKRKPAPRLREDDRPRSRTDLGSRAIRIGKFHY